MIAIFDADDPRVLDGTYDVHGFNRQERAAWDRIVKRGIKDIMPILSIYQDSKGPGTCRSCGQRIEWAELTSGKRHPFDAPIVPVRTQGALLAGERVTEHVDTSVSTSHFATCPDAAKWRQRKP